MNLKKVFLIIIVIVLAFIIYNLPYFKEMRAYNKVVEERNIVECEYYISEYPDGRHLDDVFYIKVTLLKDDMPTIVEYLNKFPNGKHSDEVNELCDKLWDEEIEKYNLRDKSLESESAVIYMSEMLNYMKTNRVNTILVDVKSTIELKDYEEYDSSVRGLLEIFNDDKMSISDGMISLKSNFTVEDNSMLMGILVEGVQKSINNMFTPNFIKVIANDEEVVSWNSVDISKSSPNLHFDYTITNQEEILDRFIIPDIWVYTDGHGKTLNYLIGITIDFNAHFSIPGSVTTFDYRETGEPSENINNVEDIEDGYRQMTRICFEKFSNKMSRNMGLNETFFKDGVGE